MISLNWTLVHQIIVFVFLIFILNKLLFQPVLDIIDKRKEETEGKEVKAKKMEKESDDIEANYKDKLKKAKIDATAQKNEIKAIGLKEEEKIIGAARQESDQTVNKIREQISGEAENARQELMSQAQGMSEMIFQRLLGRKAS